MRVDKMLSTDTITKIHDFITLISSDNKYTTAVNMLHKTEKVFSDYVEPVGTKLVCGSTELSSLVFEYIQMLSAKHHLAMCVWVENGVPVESMKWVKRLTEFASFSSVIPCGGTNNTITFDICMFGALEGEKFDVDLMAKKFCR